MPRTSPVQLGAAALRVALLFALATTAPAAQSTAAEVQRLPAPAAGPRVPLAVPGAAYAPPRLAGLPPPPAIEPVVPEPVPTPDTIYLDSAPPEFARTWQLLPDGLIYRSYLAGVKEPRFGLLVSHDQTLGAIWDVTLGGRVGILRYGTPVAYRPQGWQIDIEGAALPRLQSKEPSTPLVATDYRFGIPITYGSGRWQFKTGYSHISAHLGDEFMINNPGVQRINYVRDSIMLGVGYFVTDSLRLFGEYDYAAGVGGGAEPSEFQFGADYSPAIPGGAPFAAVYTDLRQELDFGGYFVIQGGWQWRGGLALHTLRIGAEYFNGKSPQFEFFRQSEQRFGFGLWYDY